MFENIEENYKVVEGAYKKIKSLYYYSKDKLFERLKISKFEFDLQKMGQTFNKLANFLAMPNISENKVYIENLVKKINYRLFPKKFKERQSKSKVISTTINKKELASVNFLIDMPIELMLLDCIWTLLVGQIAYDNCAISSHNYANILERDKLFYNGESVYNSIDFYSNRLFKPYFKQYSRWRNEAIQCVEKEYENGDDTILISLDLKGYFYSVDFNFANLSSLLNDDQRLTDVSFLTNIIEKIYINYTEKISVVRNGISANTKSKNVIFPFQLCSSCLLANLYLSAFDIKIEQTKGLLFYGRYVDDIILILKNDYKLNDQQAILKEYLIKSNIIEEQENDSYGILDTNVKLNTDKIKIFTFFSEDPKTLIEYIKDRMFVNVSSVDFFAAQIDEEKFSNKVYYQDTNSAYSKFKDFSILHSDNYNATQYILKLITLNRNVSDPYVEQNDSIFEFYNGTACLEFRSAWLLVLYLGVIQQNHDFIKKFYFLVQEEVKKISHKELQDIFANKKKEVTELIKNTLTDEFDIAMAIALSLNSTMNIKREKIVEYTRLIKHANMFNHRLVAYPLLNFSQQANDEKFSLIETNLEKLSKTDLVLDKFKIKYSPRFIHFEEINLFYFLMYFSKGGNIYQEKFNEIFEWFETINHIRAKYKITDTVDKNTNIELIQYSLTDTPQPFDIGIASIHITEEDCFKSIVDPDACLSVQDKIRVFNLLKLAEQNKARLVVLPECYLPIAWLSEVASFAKRCSMTIVTGLQYISCKGQAFNYIANIQPFYTDMVRYRNVFTHIREKYDYSPIEKEALYDLGLAVEDSITDVITIYDVGNKFRYCNRLCYEFTNITNRAKLRNKVELIIAPEFNRDTNYFSNIIEATARDNLCFIAQSNTSIYGDSRLIGPYSTLVKNILVVKGCKNDVMIVDNIDIYPLIKFKEGVAAGMSYEEANEFANGTYEFKKPSARFFEE